MRASRLLSILMLLQQRGRANAPTLAQALGVSMRTVLRDIDQLSAAGVPIWSDRGREGGFQLRAGWSTQLNGLTEAESHALMLAGLPRAATELGLGSASASARLKMFAAVPSNLRTEAIRVGARLHIDPVEWYRSPVAPIHLPAIAAAVWAQKVIEVRYESWEGVKQRALHPLGLVLKAGVWYCIARAAGSKSPRTYKLASIQSLRVSDELFSYPQKFDLETYWQQSIKRFERDIYTAEATLRVSQVGFKRLSEISAAIAHAAAQSRIDDASKKGWSRITIPVESIDHAARQLLGLGVEVQVIAPEALRDAVRTMAKKIVQFYG
jgi:predicted DNA-binding transcriptional regulator YafY